MKFWAILLLAPIFTLCACGSSMDTPPSYTEVSESIPLEPITPSETVTHEDWVKNITNALSTIQSLYDEMISKAAQDGAPSKAVKKANAVEKKYSERLKEISKLSLTDLSDEELKEISLELSNIISAIREANDLF